MSRLQCVTCGQNKNEIAKNIRDSGSILFNQLMVAPKARENAYSHTELVLRLVAWGLRY